MRRSSLFLLGCLFIAAPAFGQTSSADSQTLQALLAEVRQLRQDLQNITVAAQRAQILAFRLQAQQAAVTRASQRLDEARSKLEGLQAERKRDADQIKRSEEFLRENTGNPADRKQIEDWLPRGKADLEALANQEQEKQAKESECEEQLRAEQAKLTELQAQLDELDASLEKSRQQPSTRPR
jgi:DNA repair exonuclease SbcCD ATPase subunit